MPILCKDTYTKIKSNDAYKNNVTGAGAGTGTGTGTINADLKLEINTCVNALSLGIKEHCLDIYINLYKLNSRSGKQKLMEELEHCLEDNNVGV